jgi:hypothetical protein
VRFTYWIAKDFPNTESILAVMKSMQTGAALFASGFTPDPAEFRGLPLKTEMAVAGKKSFTATVVSVKEEPVDGAVFEVPGEYREMPPAALPALSR